MPSLPLDVERALRELLALVRSLSTEQLFSTGVPSDAHDENRPTEAVANFLYTNWYSPVNAENQADVTLGRTDLTAALRASVPMSTQWQHGWVVLKVDLSGACLAGRHDQTRELRPGEYVNLSRPGLPVMPGDAIGAVKCINWLDPKSGWWCQQSAIGQPAEPLVRVYWNVDQQHIGLVLGKLTSALESQQARYCLKCPSQATQYSRIDSLIVYIERSCWPGLSSIVNGIVNQVGACLRRHCPPLTQTVAPGVALAEDPGTNESFGESRCRALAPAVISILEDPTISDEYALDLLVQGLRTSGVDPVQPWRNLEHA